MLEDSSSTVLSVETAFFSASAVFDLEAKLLAIRLDPKGVAVLIKVERRVED